MISEYSISEGLPIECCEDVSLDFLNPLQLLIDLGCDACLNYIVKLSPFDITCTKDYEDFAYPGIVSEGSVSDCYQGTINGCVTPYEFANRDINCDYPIDGALKSNYKFEANAFTGQEPDGSGSTSGGIIKLDNSEGKYDDLLCLSWDGREVEIKAGSNCWSCDEYINIYTGVTKRPTWNDCEIVFATKDNSSILNCPLQTSLYQGTGKYEGGLDLFNKPKPLTFGQVFNISPVIVDANYLVYQVNDGAFNDITDVRDGGISLNYSGYDGNVYNWTPVAGEYAIDSANGFLIVGAQPQYNITVDLKGNEPLDITTADIIETVVSRCEGIKINEESLAFLRGKFPYPVGMYITESKTVLDVLNELMAGAFGWWSFNRQGELTFGLLRKPIGTLIDNVEVTSIKRLITNAPSSKRTIGYARNYTVQKESDLAFSAINKDFYSQEYREAVAFSNLNDFIYKASTESVVNSFLLYQENAQELADELLELYSDDCQSYYEIKVDCGLFKYWLGDLIKINYNRWDIQERVFTIVGIVEDAKCNSVTLKIFG